MAQISAKPFEVADVVTKNLNTSYAAHKDAKDVVVNIPPFSIQRIAD